MTDEVRFGSVGLPLPGVELRLVEDGRDVVRGDPGEVWVRGPNVFAGYWQDPEASRRALTEDGWLRTGDVGIRDDDGWLRLVDRHTDLIIVSGFNVYPREVERVLHAHPGVADVAVVGVPHPQTGETVVAHVVRAAADELSEAELDDWCRARLARYKCPTAINVVSDLPRTVTGKVRRTHLRR
jgi:long-chain acyl-CoA synthetase